MTDLPAFDRLPPVDDRRIAVRLKKSALRQVRRGHPWVFDQSIVSETFHGRPGDLAVIFDDDRKFAAIGLYDPGSPIRVRVLHAGKPASIDADFWRERLFAAAAVRAPLVEGDTTGYRLVNGENDGFPGLIVDRYAATLVVKVYSAAWLSHLKVLLPLLRSGGVVGFETDGVVLRLARQVSRGETFGLVDGQVVDGAVSEPVLFVENGLTFEAHVRTGQKTGHFLDQRDNRQLVRELSEGRRVLDVFACTGGFSVYAAAGGAVEVLSVDLSRPALETAERNFAHNPSAAAGCRHQTTVADAFDVMAALARSGETFDLVVVDPPSFAQKQSDVSRALRAYGRLTELAVALVRTGGTLVQASCSSRVDADWFYDAVHRAAHRQSVVLTELELTGHAVDHPIGFAEGAYLKAVFATVSR